MAMVTRSDLLIRLEDNTYPVMLEEVRQASPQISFGDELAEEDLQALGYALVLDSERPEGDVVTEGAPVETDGVWYRTYQVRSFSDEELAERFDIARNEFIATLDKAFDAARAVGTPYQFGDETYHIQLREKDKSNLLGLSQKALRLIAAGAGDTQMNFRPYENVSLPMPATQMSDLCDHAMYAMEALYEKVWNLKDAADAAKVGDPLPTIPEDFFA